MSNEVTHILRGVFMFLAIAIIVRLFVFVSSIPPKSSAVVHTEVQLQIPLSAIAKNGERLFKLNCASCHNLHKDLVGPALAGVEKRWPSKALLYMWIRNWPKAVASGDAYARKMKDWNPAAMNMFDFKDDEIEAILAYIKESTNKSKL